jgi:hypothetical protein
MVEIARQLDVSFMYLRPGKVPDVVSKHRRLFLFSPEDITSIRPGNPPPTKIR